MSQLIPLLNVEDVKKSIEFYKLVLEGEIESQWEMEGRVRWARIGFEGGKLMLNTPDSADSGQRRNRAEFADTVLYVMCSDAPRQREKLMAAGLDVGELSHEEYGNDEFAVRDPDGYPIRFSSPRG